MAIEVTTRDCSALGDAELSEIAEFAISEGTSFDIGVVSKFREEWVLCTEVRDGDRLVAVAFCTLERIGGTPCILVGLSVVETSSRARELLNELLAEQYRKALLAFPDEDVLVGVRLVSADGYEIFNGLQDIVPRPDHKPTGEERAWARRLAKRFGFESHLDDRTFVITPNSVISGYLAYGDPALRGDEGYGQFFNLFDPASGGTLVSFGWAMAEDLADGRLPADIA